VLHHFNPKARTQLQTDASGFALSGIISQPEPGIENPMNRHWHPVAFWSRKMTDVECRYETYDHELLAIVECFKHWHHYLEGSWYPIDVYSDHNNLRYFMTTKHLNSRQVRWALALSPFDFEIRYTPGKTNPADAPSRRPDYAPETEQGIGDLLPTFHNKMRGSFMKMLTSWVKTDSGMDAAMNRTVTTCMITAGHARGEENPLDSCRGAPPGRS